MNENFLKLSEEKKSDLIKTLASDAVQKLFLSTKAANDSDSGTFKVVISTAHVDRQGESVTQNGWDMTFYKSNPVVLWAHDYASLPIGMAEKTYTENEQTIAEGKFAPADANPFAQQVRKLYDLGMVRATSVGFIPREFSKDNNAVITKAELLEFSFVPVPANPYALTMSQIKELNLDMTLLKTKGMEFKTDEPAPAPAPAPEVTPEPKPVVDPEADKAKGEVADALAVIETQDQKWQKYCEMMEAIDALCTVYFDEATPVENFGALLLETIEILKGVAASGGASDDMKAVKEGITKMLAGRKSVRELVDKNIKILEEAVKVISLNFALGSIMRADGNAGGHGDKSAQEQRSKSSIGLVELENFLETRSLLRSVDNTIEKVLRDFNKAAQKHK